MSWASAWGSAWGSGGQQASPHLLLQSVVHFGETVADGQRIVAVATPWLEIADAIRTDRSILGEFAAHPRKFEEFLAGAYEQAGYKVILTPQSGDRGRDIIATKDGFGSIRILDQAKAYSPSHLVGHDDLRMMLGVLSGDLSASKGVVTTTSSFQPGVLTSDEFTKFMPYRLELKDGQALQAWLDDLKGK